MSEEYQRYYTERDAMTGLAKALDDLVNVEKQNDGWGLSMIDRHRREQAVERARDALAYLQSPAETPEPEEAQVVGEVRYQAVARDLMLLEGWDTKRVRLIAMSDGTVRWER